MKSIGRIIYETRKSKDISQEELAVMAKINLRTIQRIENDQNEPRGTTITLICDVLQLDPNELRSQEAQNRFNHLGHKLVNGIFLIILNITLTTIIGYLTISDIANLYSRIGAFFLSVFLPYFIVSITRNSSPLIRLIKFGTGFIIFIIIAFFQMEISKAIFMGAVPIPLIGLSILFYGDFLQLRK
ncbi:helix-turn-helix transcriptional regulator [Reichenbachiella sp. MALMAid0571]|uniref:helix-turn-helix domain-containing protein n=1 Tax=Reichenbachiella sp. MALMAid0571 TaxID=3143939 RepID=UPI0032DF6513